MSAALSSEPEEPAGPGLPGGGWDGEEGIPQGLYVTAPAEDLTLEGFAAGGRADTMAPGPLLAMVLGAVAGEDGKGLAGLSDDQLIGFLSGTRRMESRLAWAKMAALAEFASRPRRDDFAATTAPRRGRRGVSPVLAVGGGADRVRPGGGPAAAGHLRRAGRREAGPGARQDHRGRHQRPVGRGRRPRGRDPRRAGAVEDLRRAPPDREPAGPQARSRGGPQAQGKGPARSAGPGVPGAVRQRRDQRPGAAQRGSPGLDAARCNLAPLCRHHHRCKQAEGWRLEQPEPGVLVWHTPAGRTYTTTPTQYAA